MRNTEIGRGPDDADASDLRAVLPHLMQLGNVLNRSDLVERAREQAGADLDRPALSILIVLRLTGEALRVGEIAARMQVAGPHVTRHVHVLERRRLVRRRTDADDRRARLVELTPAGAEAVDRYLQVIFERFGDALTDWSAQDRSTFYRLLQRFTADLAARLPAAGE